MGAETEDALGETGETYGRLDRLLKQAEPRVLGQPPPAGIGGAKVKIEVAPDNAVGAVLKAARAEKGAGQAVVLLEAEAILPGEAGDVVAEMGSWMLAEMAKKQGAKVDRVCPPPQAASAGLTASFSGLRHRHLRHHPPFLPSLSTPRNARPDRAPLRLVGHPRSRDERPRRLCSRFGRRWTA